LDSWLANKGLASLVVGQQRMLAQTVARKFGVPYGNQVDWLVAARSGIAAKGDPSLKYPDAKQEVCPDCEEIMSPK
jgi:hypothetical protein